MITAPPSKSYTHRTIFAAALAPGKSVIRNCLVSEDTLSTIRAAESFGASVVSLRNDGCSADLEISGVPFPDFSGSSDLSGSDGVSGRSGGISVDCGNSGTTLRLLTGIASLCAEPVTITGDASLQKRPVLPLLRSLESGGVSCLSKNGFPPVTVCGPNAGTVFRIPGNVSSQFITSLLMTAPLLKNDSSVIVSGKISSKPYIDITLRVMGTAGASVFRKDSHESPQGSLHESPQGSPQESSLRTVSDDAVFRIRHSGYRPFEQTIPGDFSSAAFLLTAGAVSKDERLSSLSVSGLDLSDVQGDKKITDILRDAGAPVTAAGNTVSVRKICGRPGSLDLDMGNIPDLFPVTAVLLSTADGKSRLYGAPQLRFKESDRIAAVVDMIRSLGGKAEETNDGCIIEGVPELSGGFVRSRGDHRILMAAAIASLVSSGPVITDDPECCRISYPGFIEDIRKAGISVVRGSSFSRPEQ